MEEIVANCKHSDNSKMHIPLKIANCYHSEMNNKEIRHLNLSKLLERFSTKRSFAEKCDLAPGHVSQMYNKSRDIGDRVAEKIELSLGLSRGWMDQRHDEPEPLKSQNSSESNIDFLTPAKKVPVIDMVAAGNWCEVADPYPVGDAESWESCPVPHGEHTFALRINGESMAPKFQHGEIIFCDPCKKAENGDFVIAKLTDENQATFKQLIIEGGQSMLKALNPAWPTPYTPINGNCHIVGKVIARLEKF